MSNNQNLLDLVVDERSSSDQNPLDLVVDERNSSDQNLLDLVAVFPFINIPTTEQYYDISDIIPNIKLRIRWDGNIPQPTLSFSNILKKDKYNSDYSQIPNGIEVWMYPSIHNFKKEFYNTITKDILIPHNEYMYALKTYNNYKIVYNNTVIMQLTNQQGWNIHQTPTIVEPSAPILPSFFW